MSLTFIIDLRVVLRNGSFVRIWRLSELLALKVNDFNFQFNKNIVKELPKGRTVAFAESGRLGCCCPCVTTSDVYLLQPLPIEINWFIRRIYET